MDPEPADPAPGYSNSLTTIATNDRCRIPTDQSAATLYTDLDRVVRGTTATLCGERALVASTRRALRNGVLRPWKEFAWSRDECQAKAEPCARSSVLVGVIHQHLSLFSSSSILLGTRGLRSCV
jgi:hypothetical protein